MNCKSHRNALLDLSRDVPLPASIAQAAHAHIESCDACASELRRQRELTADFATVRTGAGDWRAPEDLEARILAAVESRSEVAAKTSYFRSRRVYTSLAAAAAILLAVGIAQRTRHGNIAGERPGALQTPAAGHPTRVEGQAATPVAPSVPARLIQREKATGKSERRVSRSAPEGAAVEFVAVPGAAALPMLESGRIIRVKLGIAELPTYGLAIVPDAARSAVEADVLVGQDGQARAIRLLAWQPESRSAQ